MVSFVYMFHEPYLCFRAYPNASKQAKYAINIIDQQPQQVP